MQHTSESQMLFIAQLNGFNGTTIKQKVQFGIDCYSEHKLHNLNPNDEEDRKEFHENIWLTRLYKELDEVHNVSSPLERRLAIDTEDYSNTIKWSVPIEADASALTKCY